MDQSFLSMSDADFAKMGGVMPTPAPAEEKKPEASTEPTEPAPDAGAVEAGAPEGGQESQTANEGGEQEEGGPAADANAEAAANADANAPHEEGGEEDGGVTDPGVETPAKAAVPPKEALEALGLPEDAGRIFETFRANGRDMKVKSVDEAIRLMQMGANYSQRRAADKQKMTFVKTLEQNGLLDHEKLSFAIDLVNGNPQAIAKLVADSKIDIHSLDEDQAKGYKAGSKAPTSAQMDLAEVVEELKPNANFQKLITQVENWDERSQGVLANSPSIMAELVGQMDSGVYDTIMEEVERRRTLGILGKKPLLQEYDEVGIELAKEGRFNPAPKEPVKVLVTPGKKQTSAKPADDARRRAAAPSKASTATQVEPEKKNFLNMSDEDFLAQTRKR